MLRVLTTLLLATMLVVTAGCGSGDEGPNGAASSAPSAGDAAFGKGDVDAQDSGDQGWDLQPGSGQPTSTQTTPPPATGNKPPQVSAMVLDPSGANVAKNGTVRLSVTASDPDGDTLQFKWAATGGSFDSVEGFRAVWRAPDMLATFVVTVEVTDGKGGTATGQQSFTVVSNASPVIRSLTANQTSVAPGGMVVLVGGADDPDGDPVTYKWSADGGTITGSGSSVTWIAPVVKPGEKSDYTIQLAAEDGRGGYDVRSVEVAVTFGYTTKIFSPIPAETGTVIRDGTNDLTMLKAGDNEKNQAMRAFAGFDLYELRHTDVTKATLTFTHRQTVGNPFVMPTGIRGIRVHVVRYDAGSLPPYLTESVEELTTSVLMESPTEFDVTKFVRSIGQGMSGSDKLQFMVTFQVATNSDSVADYMVWDKVTITATYTPV